MKFSEIANRLIRISTPLGGLLLAVHLLLLVAVFWCFWTVVGLFGFRLWPRYIRSSCPEFLDFLFFTALSAAPCVAVTGSSKPIKEQS